MGAEERIVAMQDGKHKLQKGRNFESLLSASFLSVKIELTKYFTACLRKVGFD